MIKILVLIVFLLILFNLGVALFHLVHPKDAEHSQKTVKALTFRIGLSLLLFIALVIAISLRHTETAWYRCEYPTTSCDPSANAPIKSY